MDRREMIRIGTRGSLLALAQTDQVIAVLRERYPQLRIEKVILHTKGDKILDKPLVEFGGKGAFVSEFEEALTDGRIDLAVHSAKDMPMNLAEGLVVAGTLPRADARDVLVVRKGLIVPKRNEKKEEDFAWEKLADIVIGTGSLRRQFQLKALSPDIRCISMRGNVPTRLQKVRDGECDGVVLAAAGLERLKLLQEKEFDYHFFSYDEMIPAGGQGIIAIEGRAGDEITNLAGSISRRETLMELETERRVLQLSGAGCHEALGVFSEISDEQITMRAIRERNGKIYKSERKTEVEKRIMMAEQIVGNLQE